MHRINVYLDKAQPRDAMRVIVTTDTEIGVVMYISKEAFAFLFDAPAKEGISLEFDIENVTNELRASVRAKYMKKKIGE